MDERKKLIEGRTDMAAHAEWRDDITALIATKRAVGYAQATGHRLHVLHLTSGIEADYLVTLRRFMERKERRTSRPKCYHNT